MRYIFYISNHGFGHIARNISVIAKLAKKENVFIYVVCGLEQIKFAKDVLKLMLDEPEYKRIFYRDMDTDIGLILYSGTLDVDVKLLAKKCRNFLERIPAISENETEWLKMHNISAALCDMPIWAIKACKLADIPLIYIGNFTWAELYRELLPKDIVDSYAEYYGLVNNALLLPFHTEEMLDFLHSENIMETSLLARPFNETAVDHIRNGHSCPIVFIALGMSAHFYEKVDVSNVNAFFYANEGVPLIGNNVQILPRDTINTQDYIKAADYVITKAGWGTVAEAILAQKPMALFKRDGVLEDRNTIAKLCEKEFAIEIEQNDIYDIENVIKRMKQLKTNCYDGYYEASSEVADALVAIGES